MFPFGNSNAPPNDTVSVYLDYADPKRAPEGWHACAQFALVISNPHDPTIYTVSRACSFFSHTRCSGDVLNSPHFSYQTRTIVSLRRNAIGVLPASASCVSSSAYKKATLDRRLRTRRLTYLCSCEYWRIPLACCGTTSSSASPSTLLSLAISDPEFIDA